MSTAFVRGVLLCATTVVACGSPPFDRSAAEKAVLAAVLESQIGPNNDSAHIVLDPVFVGGSVEDAALNLDAALLADLRAALAEDSVVLPLPTAYRVSIDTTRPLRLAARDSLLKASPFQSRAGFAIVQAAYPGAKAIYGVSHVGFSRNGRRAALLLDMNCGMLCGEGRLVELRFRGETWELVRVESLWVR